MSDDLTRKLGSAPYPDLGWECLGCGEKIEDINGPCRCPGFREKETGTYSVEFDPPSLGQRHVIEIEFSKPRSLLREGLDTATDPVSCWGREVGAGGEGGDG